MRKYFKGIIDLIEQKAFQFNDNPDDYPEECTDSGFYAGSGKRVSIMP
jgi:hypothetical protein